MFPDTSYEYENDNSIGIDVESLRRCILDDIYGLGFAVDHAAWAEIPKVERASEEEIIEMAQEREIDLNKYRARNAGRTENE